MIGGKKVTVKGIKMNAKERKEYLKKESWTGPGWDHIIDTLDNKLSNIDPNYDINQVKEKFGLLRYYYTPSTGFWKPDGGKTDEYDAMSLAVSQAEGESGRTCEECGDPGEMRDERHWLRTLCDPCNEENNRSYSDWSNK